MKLVSGQKVMVGYVPDKKNKRDEADEWIRCDTLLVTIKQKIQWRVYS